MPPDPPILYSYFRSSASWRVRIALAIKGIDYEYRAVNLIKDGGQQRTSEYKERNPMAQVPALVIDGVTLTQSLAIIEYIEETRPENPIHPKDPVARAQARKLAEIINSGIQPIQNLSVLQHVEKLTSRPESKAEWGHFFINKGFVALEKEIAQTAGKYSVGDTVTIADLCLVPQVYNANRFKVDLDAFPTIKRVAAALAELDAFKKADPVAQPDCPEDLKP
ncbi:hypothetical protein CAPTEDRAFT_17982 [Capitella teleta]|uniref:Uncharacterized protein n=1 Tax=Capitella teleta TaxID=283909 RepID=R7UCZ0_CAPTE|nr:hypothetical protein CAPTEDRAFT_17982 [Capitella teleta]|eukprot:ELU01132.1 hypothetical protein CAPTEDRAFT_17982 [Capitella teleta]